MYDNRDKARKIIIYAGCHGGSTAEQYHGSSYGDADRLCRLHDSTGGCSYAGANDIHVHITEHRGRLQSAQHKSSARVASRTSALVHRGCVGLLHVARPPAVPTGDRDTLLGEVLRLFAGGRLVGLHSADTGIDNLPRVRDTLLSELGRA